MAIDIKSKSKIQPGKEYGAFAAAKVPDSAGKNPSAFRAAAEKAGFSHIGTNTYQQADGSWLVREGTKIHRGVGNEIFGSVPKHVLDLPIAQRNPASTTAIMKVAMVNGDDSRQKAALTRDGFVRINANYYAHADGSWVAFANNQRVFGFKQRRVGGPQQAKMSAAKLKYTAAQAAGLSAIRPAPEHGYLATAQIGFLNSPFDANAKRTLKQAGFQESSPNFFQHKDGSWITNNANRIERGFKGNRFSVVPQGIARTGNGSAPTANHFGLSIAHGDIAAITAKSFDKSHDKLTKNGFKQITPNYYRHADGGFIALTAGKVYFGHNNTRLTKAPDLKGLPAKKPTPQDVLKMAPLWGLTPSMSPKKAATELKKRGFKEERPEFFRKGTTWVSTEGSKLSFGNGAQRFTTVPKLSDVPQTTAKAEHKWMAIAQTRGVKANAKNLKTQLTKLGFKEEAPNFFKHTDGSFVAVEGSKLIRGAGNQRLKSLPAAPKANEMRQYTSLPSRSWTWYAQNTALGKTPIMYSTSDAAHTLPGLGYKKSGNRWTHPDGSYVNVGGGRLSLGWQKWSLGQLPFNNRTSRY